MHLEQTSRLRVVVATGFVRRMRGGSQACLLTTADGEMYVVKFRNNPQHLRTLVNEIVATLCANRIGITTPELCLVYVDQSLATNHVADLAIRLAHGSVPIQAGMHLGSCHPSTVANPAVVYDFLPALRSWNIANFRDFVGVFVLDKWIANSDSRQAIFVRMREPDRQDARYQIQMIDHGSAFGGSSWRFADAPLAGRYHDPTVYSDVTSLTDFEPWIQQIRAIDESFVQLVMRHIPQAWVAGESRELIVLLERLMRRRTMLASLIQDVLDCKSNPFVNWGMSRV
jgi:hypothetical protein